MAGELSIVIFLCYRSVLSRTLSSYIRPAFSVGQVLNIREGKHHRRIGRSIFIKSNFPPQYFPLSMSVIALSYPPLVLAIKNAMHIPSSCKIPSIPPTEAIKVASANFHMQPIM